MYLFAHSRARVPINLQLHPLLERRRCRSGRLQVTRAGCRTTLRLPSRRRLAPSYTSRRHIARYNDVSIRHQWRHRMYTYVHVFVRLKLYFCYIKRRDYTMSNCWIYISRDGSWEGYHGSWYAMIAPVRDVWYSKHLVGHFIFNCCESRIYLSNRLKLKQHIHTYASIYIHPSILQSMGDTFFYRPTRSTQSAKQQVLCT